MCGRTHGQPGLPMTFGFKAAVWAAELGRHLERIGQARPRLEVVQLGGALGTMEFWGDDALPLLDAFAAPAGAGRAGHPVDHRPRPDRRVRRAARDGDGDPREDRQRGLRAAAAGDRGDRASRSLPARSAASRCRTSATRSSPSTSTPSARIVRADAGVALEGMVALHERDGRGWKAEWLVLPEACLLTGAALAFAARLLEGLHVDVERMGANLDAQRRLPAVGTGDARARRPRRQARRPTRPSTRPRMAGLEQGVDLRTALTADRPRRPLAASHPTRWTPPSTRPRRWARRPPSSIGSSGAMPRGAGTVTGLLDVAAGAARDLPDAAAAGAEAVGGDRRGGVAQARRPHRAGPGRQQGACPRVPPRGRRRAAAATAS